MYLHLALRARQTCLFLNTISIQSPVFDFTGVRGLKMWTTKPKTTLKNLQNIKHFYITNNNATQDVSNTQNTNYDGNCNVLDTEYERAIQALNLLQSNADTLRLAVMKNIKQKPLDDTVELLERIGLTLDEVEKLSFIHVSGSKGKGSTCALTESILREHGIKTGFFSSPHLISVQERIRINGQPIDKQKFTAAFWPVLERLQKTSKHLSDMPAYFKFLFLLSLHIFLAEQVDVVILEVGIGGELDCTNIIRNTGTVGISSLGLEHTGILGNTLPEIAWQKAGIIKPGSHVFTSASQPECLQVIRERAASKEAILSAVPPLSSYKSDVDLGIFNEMVQLNGSLAIQLAYDWLRQHKNYKNEHDLQINNKIIKAFNNCIWTGRCQIIRMKNFNFHLDGAHTIESMNICMEWFLKSTVKNNHEKVLIFNITGDRDSNKLLSILNSTNQFTFVCFVPNFTSTVGYIKDNQTVFNHSDQLKRAQLHADNWIALNSQSECKVFESILDSFQYLRKRFNANHPVDILVTGSLHLIGATLLALDELRK